MKKYFNISIIVLSAILQGCSITPYQEESSCKFGDLGKCLPIDKAYKEAVTGISQGGDNVNGKKSTPIITQFTNKSLDTTPYSDYQNATYQKIKKMIKSEEMPLLQPAVVRKVLILSYSSKDLGIWYEPRSVYYIEKTPQWTLDKFNVRNKQDKQISLYK